MKIKNNFLVKLFIVFISFTLIDGGKTFVLAGSNISFIINHKHSHDLEEPDHATLNLPDNEKWIDPDNKNKAIYSSVSPASIRNSQNFKTREFSKLIWQPPKSV
jgi:hypothetical protein